MWTDHIRLNLFEDIIFKKAILAKILWGAPDDANAVMMTKEQANYLDRLWIELIGIIEIIFQLNTFELGLYEKTDGVWKRINK